MLNHIGANQYGSGVRFKILAKIERGRRKERKRERRGGKERKRPAVARRSHRRAAKAFELHSPLRDARREIERGEGKVEE